MGIVRGMGQLGATYDIRQCARFFVLGAGCLMLANCSNGQMAGKVDPRYGVASSARVVEPGEPVPKGGGVYRIGKPYAVAGRVYTPEENIDYSAVGMASWYGNDFHGRYTANGEVFDMNSISAAHPTLPLPSYVRVTNLANSRSIVVRVNDRGPYAGNRLIDVSVKTAELLGFYGNGLARVKVEYVGRAPLQGSDDRKLVATLREGSPAIAPVQVVCKVNRGRRRGAATLRRGRPMTNFSSTGVPSPPDRPYRLGEGAREIAAESSTTELAASARTRAGPVMSDPRAEAAPVSTPVSAYVPTRYDGRSGYMSGRGLY